MPCVLATLGPGSFNMLAGMVRDRELDEWVRIGAANALLMISRKNQEVKTQCVQLLKNVIPTETERATITFFLDMLVEFRDEQSMTFIKSFFEREMVDTSYLTYDEVLRVYAGEYDHLEDDIPKDPMYIFREEKGNFYRESNCIIAEHLKRNESNREHVDAMSAGEDEERGYNEVYIKKGSKIGRNEPCPCGSGKKYKKCCMKIP